MGMAYGDMRHLPYPKDDKEWDECAYEVTLRFARAEGGAAGYGVQLEVTNPDQDEVRPRPEGARPAVDAVRGARRERGRGAHRGARRVWHHAARRGGQGACKRADAQGV